MFKQTVCMNCYYVFLGICGTRKIGESFVSEDCTGYCQCAGPDAVQCVSLCPPSNIACPPGSEKVRTEVPVSDVSSCTCPLWKCV